MMGAPLFDVNRGLEEGEASRVLGLLRGFYRLARSADAVDVASEVEAIGRALRVAHGPNLRLLIDAARAWYDAHSSEVRKWLRGPFEEQRPP